MDNLTLDELFALAETIGPHSEQIDELPSLEDLLAAAAVLTA